MSRKKEVIEETVSANAETLENDENKNPIPYKKGQIIWDVKIVDIVPDNPRCIRYVFAKRDRTGKIGMGRDGKMVLLRGTGNLVKDYNGKMIWDEEVHSMTLEDFKSFIEARPRYALLT